MTMLTQMCRRARVKDSAVIEGHAGRIWAENRPSEESTFSSVTI
jgi:hypothetical protein